MRNLLRFMLPALMLFGTTTFAHQGTTNASGCHSDGSGYHCHTAYGQNTHPSYRCHTNASTGYSRYNNNDPRSLTYSCNGGNGYNSYDYYSRYSHNRNYQTYYGTPTYYNHNINRVHQHTSHCKHGSTHAKTRTRQVYGNQLVNRDYNNRYYSVPTRLQSATMRNYNTWPYVR